MPQISGNGITVNIYGVGPQTANPVRASHLQCSQGTETRTYLPFEINLQNMKYIPLHMRRASSYSTFLGDIFNYVI